MTEALGVDKWVGGGGMTERGYGGKRGGALRRRNQAQVEWKKKRMENRSREKVAGRKM